MRCFVFLITYNLCARKTALKKIICFFRYLNTNSILKLELCNVYFIFFVTPNDSGRLRTTPTPGDSGRLRTTPTTTNDSERLRATPVDSGRLRTTPDDSERLRATPDGSGRLRTTPDDTGRLRLRADVVVPFYRSRNRTNNSRSRIGVVGALHTAHH